MKSPLNAVAAALLCSVAFSGVASAGSLSDPIVEVPPTLAKTSDWQGVRAGLTYNSEIANHTLATSEGFPYVDTSAELNQSFGAFLGYDHQVGNMVYGVELQHIFRDAVVELCPCREHKDLTSLRARLGYSAGKALFYGSLGAAKSTFQDVDDTIDMNGYVAGIGVEYKLNDNAFVGLAIDHYALTGAFIATEAEAEHTVIQLRVGYSF